MPFKVSIGSMLIGVVLGIAGSVIGVVVTNMTLPEQSDDYIYTKFNSEYLQPLVPPSEFEIQSSRSLGAFFSVDTVTDATTTIIFNDAATAPCRFELPTNAVTIVGEMHGASFLRLSYDDGVNESDLQSCADLTTNLKSVEITAEPEVAAQFAR